MLAPALHKYLIPCAPIEPSTEFDRMQQRVVIGALRNEDGALGLVVTVEDVTARLETERRVARQLRDGSPAERVVAIRELATFEPSEGVGPIGSALADDDWQVRGAAVRALASRRDARARGHGDQRAARRTSQFQRAEQRLAAAVADRRRRHRRAGVADGACRCRSSYSGGTGARHATPPRGHRRADRGVRRSRSST